MSGDNPVRDPDPEAQVGTAPVELDAGIVSLAWSCTEKLTSAFSESSRQPARASSGSAVTVFARRVQLRR